jgi:hypothetical protein
MGTESALEIKVVRKIEEISPQEWLSVFPRVLENYYFFKTLDESSMGQFSFFYILVYDNKIPVGAASCFTMNFPMDVAIGGKLKKITDFIKRFFPRIFSPKILICGLPMGQGRIGITGDPGRIIKAINKTMEEIARQEKAGVIAFKDFNSDYRKIFDKFLGRDFTRMHSLPSTDMDIPFTSFEQYLKTLSGISRSGLRRKFKEVDGRVRIDLEVRENLEEGVLEEVYALYLQTLQRQEISLEELSKEFFRSISNNMPGEIKFFLWRIDGKLAAFALCLVSGSYFIDYYLGFDYAIAYKYHLYFIRFRDLMNWCMENKISKYEMGSTGYEPKRRLNFNLIPLYIYAKHRNRLLNPVFKIFSYIARPVNFHTVVKELN